MTSLFGSRYSNQCFLGGKFHGHVLKNKRKFWRKLYIYAFVDYVDKHGKKKRERKKTKTQVINEQSSTCDWRIPAVKTEYFADAKLMTTWLYNIGPSF